MDVQFNAPSEPPEQLPPTPWRQGLGWLAVFMTIGLAVAMGYIIVMSDVFIWGRTSPYYPCSPAEGFLSLAFGNLPTAAYLLLSRKFLFRPKFAVNFYAFLGMITLGWCHYSLVISEERLNMLQLIALTCAIAFGLCFRFGQFNRKVAVRLFFWTVPAILIGAMLVMYGEPTEYGCH